MISAHTSRLWRFGCVTQSLTSSGASGKPAVASDLEGHFVRLSDGTKLAYDGLVSPRAFGLAGFRIPVQRAAAM